MQKNILIAVLITAVLFGGAGFFGGTLYSKSKSPFANLQNGQMRFQGMAANLDGGIRAGGGNRAGAGMAFGEIIAKDEQSITVKMSAPARVKDGSNSANTNINIETGSKIIFFSNTTEIGKFVNGALADLAIGETVVVNGKTNTDGSITAQSIQIRPATFAPGPAGQ